MLLAWPWNSAVRIGRLQSPVLVPDSVRVQVVANRLRIATVKYIAVFLRGKLLDCYSCRTPDTIILKLSITIDLHATFLWCSAVGILYRSDCIPNFITLRLPPR